MKFREGPGEDFYHKAAAGQSYGRIHSYSAKDVRMVVNLCHTVPVVLQSEILLWPRRD
jgi:hypothetical protein